MSLTPCKLRGFQEGDFFVVSRDCEVAKHTTVQLTMDDTTSLPMFRVDETNRRVFLYVGNVIKVGKNKTYCSHKGIAVGMTVKSLGSAGPFSNAEYGDTLELFHDDNTQCPYFVNHSKGGARQVCELSSVVLPRDFVERPQEPFSQAALNDEEESDMGYKTPAQQMGLSIGDKVVMTSKEDDMDVGMELTFVEDDESNCPYFTTADGRRVCPWLSNLEKRKSKGSDVLKNSEDVEVGGRVETGDLIITKDAEIKVVDGPQDEPDIDDEYSILGGYVRLSDIASIVRPKVEKEHEVEVTIKLSHSQARKIRRSGRLLESSEISGSYSDEFRASMEALASATCKALRADEEDEEDDRW